jgi:hypothetical protein
MINTLTKKEKKGRKRKKNKFLLLLFLFFLNLNFKKKTKINLRIYYIVVNNCIYNNYNNKKYLIKKREGEKTKKLKNV